MEEGSFTVGVVFYCLPLLPLFPDILLVIESATVQIQARPDIGALDLIAPVLVAILYICACSLIREPKRRNFNAIMIAGAGPAYPQWRIRALGVRFHCSRYLFRVPRASLLQLHRYRLAAAHRLGCGCLARQPRHRRLMNDDARVRQREALRGSTCGQQQGSHRGGLPNARRHHVGPDVLHRVVNRLNRHPGGYRAARRINIELDIALGVFSFQKQQLGRH